MVSMTEAPAESDYQVIRLGGAAAVVVPLDEYRRLRELEQRAQMADSVDAEEAAALAEYRERQRSGTLNLVPQDEVRHRLGIGT